MKNLSLEEQKSLIKDWKEHKKESSLNKLIESNRKLVYKIAQKQHKVNKNLDFEDLVQEGFLGLSIAVDKFDLDKNNKFTTYATGWVLQRIRAYVISNRSLVRLGTTQDNRKIFYYYNKVKSKVEEEFPELSKEERTELICKKMGVKRKNLDKMLNVISGYDISLDSKLKSDDDESSLYDILPDKESTFYSSIEEKDISDRFILALKVIMDNDLNPEQQIVIKNRYLLEERMTYDEIAKLMKVSRQYVMTREEHALKIIKAKLKLRFKLDKSCFF